MFKRTAPALDRFVSKVTGGKQTAAGLFLPTLIVENTGRKSGRTFRTPLAFVDDGDRFLIMGSNWGQTHHPAWTSNLIANPETVVELKGERIPVRARLLTDDE